MTRWGEWVAVIVASAFCAASTFAMSAQPLERLGFISFPFWLSAGVIFATGVLIALVLIDLKRVFISVPAVAVLATILYAATLMAPSVTMSYYTVRLGNYALVQSVPVVIITLVATAIGALAGTIVNTSIREYDL